MIPLAFKGQHPYLNILDKITVAIFIVDYILRLSVADLKLVKGVQSFLIYPFTPMALVDLVSILPSVTIINSGFKLLKVIRLFRAFRVFRVFKAFRYSKNISIILAVFRKQKDSLLVVCWLAGGYILISALIMFNVEPDTFGNFFDAIYWATVSLTTVGYGDIYATSTLGKIITMISSIFGIAIVALPAGIITAGYMDEINK
ncbi:MAG: ion transporter, partial [Blautia sp.]|nr:ion transporter [Blautia sp.]